MRRLLVFVVLALIAAACGSKSKDLLVKPYDAGSDGAPDDGGADAPSDADPTLGGPCVDDGQCDDMLACTFDACDKKVLRCRNVPDDTRCDDGMFCNGRERCVLAHGCEQGPVVTCEDGSSCTIDRCVEATKSCVNAPRDLDGDGDPDDHCVLMHDCDDRDPNVASTHSEVCANNKDDNCNGQVDEAGCVTPVGATCATAIAVGAPGTYALSTVGASKTFATTCSVTTPTAGKDVVVAITIPAGPNKDLEVWATATNSEASVAIQSTCGQAASELACGSGTGATSVRARARNLAPGTYYAIVTTQAETNAELRVAFLDPTPKPTNETCANAIPIVPEVATTVQIVDPAKDLVSGCGAATGELTYTLTLTQPSDVKIFASTVVGSGSAVIGLRAPHCTSSGDELRCRVGSTLPLFARGLAAGTYVVTVAATSPIDTVVTARVSAPTTPPPDQTCATAPPVVVNATMPVDLSDHEDAIKDGCFSGGPNAAYDLPLAVASDVLVVGRFSQAEAGAVSFDAPACGVVDRLACNGGLTPVRVSKRSVPPGDYRVVIADTVGALTSLTTLVRPTVPPTTVSGADLCSGAVDIPDTGGFFTGDTTTATANYGSTCDNPNAPPNGAPDQVLHLVLTQARRVVFDMTGSTYTTLLEVRVGPTCPGPVFMDACYVGFSGDRSFLDLQLPAGSYWVIVHGYNGEKGPFNLDVRVVPP